ncbi:MAG: hypothetical protein II670_13400 [Alphaproteobacteria bacterium]|nr:hypothetical protein [Alphaproteobacteria bacterium]
MNILKIVVLSLYVFFCVACSDKNSSEKVLLTESFPVTFSGIVYGELRENGSVKPMYPKIPLMDSIPSATERSTLINSRLSRVIKAYVIKSSMTEYDSLKIRLSMRKEDKTPYDFKLVNLVLYRNGEEDGFYVFQTMTNSKGKPLLFSKNENDIGNFDDAVVLCIKKFTDRFYYDLLE